MRLLGKIQSVLGVGLAVFILLAPGREVFASSLSISPGSGTFEVGSAFDVSIMLDTEGKSVNAVRVALSFAPEKLQIISPPAGQSAVSIWVIPPTYDNKSGTVNLEGGFVNGINAPDVLIAKLSFRVKGGGTTLIKINSNSKVLLNNGKGTGDLGHIDNGIFSLKLPPSSGPEVVSDTHPDQSRWYNGSPIVLKWGGLDQSAIMGYSYVVSDGLGDVPDNISEGDRNTVAFESLSDGRHYFHIKALNRDGIWGGVTHYAVNVDKNPPADFSVDIFPSSLTDSRNPIIQFITTDKESKVDHYELKIISLDRHGEGDQEMFIEANSPYLSQHLEPGKYDVIVRAYDRAFNYRESVRRLKITDAVFRFISYEGIAISDQMIISWPSFFLVALAVIFLLGYVLWRLRHYRFRLEVDRNEKRLPSEIRQKMEELKRLKEKYRNLVLVLIFVVGIHFWAFPGVSSASGGINPPLITTISESISNDEIFYVGGRTGTDGEKITIYVKNARTGETFSEVVPPDNRGEWFYRHDTFLSEGEYVLWAQSKLGEQESPPSPQVNMTVAKTAFQIGSSRMDYEMLLTLVVVSLFLIIVAMSLLIFGSVRKIRKKRRLFRKEINEVENAVHRGFMLLHREITKELKLLRGSNAQKGDSSGEESTYREHLMDDLKKIERHIEKEILDVEKLMQ